MTDPEQGVAVANRHKILKTERSRRRKKLIKQELHDFSTATTLHGLRYITDRRLSIVEKAFWFVIFFLSVGFCIYRINAVWNKWQDSPMLVTVNERLVSVGSVPFPSVTICPQMKTKASEFNYSAVIQKVYFHYNHTERQRITKEKEIFESLLLICNDAHSVISYIDITDDLTRENPTVVENLIKAAPSTDDILYNCKFRNIHGCEGIMFKRVLTKEGICYNMNSVQAEEMFREENLHREYEYLEKKLNTPKIGWDINGFYDPSEEDPYPRRGRGDGVNPELEITFLENKVDHDTMCNSLNSGFKVYIQHPDDMPSTSMHHYDVTPRRQTSLALKINILGTEEKLREVSPEIRQCFFPGEKQLRYFKLYTMSNCNMECVTNITFKECHCVGFYMPRETGRKICTFVDTYCMDSAQKTLAEKEGNSKVCNCLPSCNSVDYEAEVIKSEFNYKTYLRALNAQYQDEWLDNMTKSYTYSLMRMYYKKPHFISMRRSELFGITDFLANCGGLLGLFLGFSFLSLVEIIYFITLRLWCTIKRDMKNEDNAELKES